MDDGLEIEFDIEELMQVSTYSTCVSSLYETADVWKVFSDLTVTGAVSARLCFAL